jgi:type IV fimbrial biogenesis protein FimT
MLMRRAPRARSRGMTLIELMIGVAILGALVMIALPNFREMLRNYEVRAAAESVANGLHRARTEAITKNASVHFLLGSGTAWTVDYVNKPVMTDPPLDSRASNEGSPNASLTALASDLATAANRITFNNLGQVVANADASPAIARVNVTGAEATQTLRITIGAGGNARVCDPSLPAGNVRAC